jgi:hypothetical protein
MNYTLPVSDALNFDFTDQIYIPPLGTAGVFEFGETPNGPSIIYPAPPSLIVSSGFAIVLTGINLISARAAQYSMTPKSQTAYREVGASSANYKTNNMNAQFWERTFAQDGGADWSQHKWDKAASLNPKASSRWDKVARKDDSALPQSWDISIKPIDEAIPLPWFMPPFKDITDKQIYIDSVKFWDQPPAAQESTFYSPGFKSFNLRNSYLVPDALSVNFNFLPEFGVNVPNELVRPTRPVDSGRDMQGWEINTPTDSRLLHPWDSKPRIGSELEWDYDQEPPLPAKDPADAPEIKEAYLYMNASSLKKMPEGIPLEFADLQISLDIDSFSWAMSASILNSSSMDQIRPGPSGPVEVEAKVNNKTWRFMVERYTVTSRHPKTAYKVSGSSLTQLLADPYSAKQSAQINTPTNALQVIQSVLVNTGFEIDWDVSLADYTIPAGAWGYENKAPIEVIDELVKAAGGVLVPATALSKLYAAQRYREAPPWYWQSLSVSSLDFQVADSTILSLSSEWHPSTEYRGVYISGITQGVAVDVTKTGTDGTPRAPDVYDALNLTAQQCRGRGISILGQSGAQEIITIELPLPTSGAPGLVVPGKWGEIQDTNDSENNWRALVLSTTVSVSRPGASRATQTIRLERHHY